MIIGNSLSTTKADSEKNDPGNFFSKESPFQKSKGKQGIGTDDGAFFPAGDSIQIPGPGKENVLSSVATEKNIDKQRAGNPILFPQTDSTLVFLRVGVSLATPEEAVFGKQQPMYSLTPEERNQMMETRREDGKEYPVSEFVTRSERRAES